MFTESRQTGTAAAWRRIRPLLCCCPRLLISCMSGSSHPRHPAATTGNTESVNAQNAAIERCPRAPAASEYSEAHRGRRHQNSICVSLTSGCLTSASRRSSVQGSWAAVSIHPARNGPGVPSSRAQSGSLSRSKNRHVKCYHFLYDYLGVAMMFPHAGECKPSINSDAEYHDTSARKRPKTRSFPCQRRQSYSQPPSAP